MDCKNTPDAGRMNSIKKGEVETADERGKEGNGSIMWLNEWKSVRRGIGWKRHEARCQRAHIQTKLYVKKKSSRVKP